MESRVTTLFLSWVALGIADLVVFWGGPSVLWVVVLGSAWIVAGAILLARGPSQRVGQTFRDGLARDGSRPTIIAFTLLLFLWTLMFSADAVLFAITLGAALAIVLVGLGVRVRIIQHMQHVALAGFAIPRHLSVLHTGNLGG
jgi:hypothetical protein